MATQVYDVYKGFAKAVGDTFPISFVKAHTGVQWDNSSIYQVDIKNAKFNVSGAFYGVCVVNITEISQTVDGYQLVEHGDLPYGVVIAEDSDLHRELTSLVGSGDLSQDRLNNLQDVWRKVLKDRIELLELNEGLQPRWVGANFQIPRDERVAIEEFKREVKTALGGFYVGLVDKLAGAKGSYAVLVKDIHLDYSGVYTIRFQTKVVNPNKKQEVLVDFALTVDYTYYHKKIIGKLLPITRELVSQFTAAQKTPFEFGELRLMLMEYSGIPNTLKWLVSDDSEFTKEIQSRLMTVFYKEDVKPYLDVKPLKGNVFQVKIKPLQGATTNEPLYFGANGIAYGIHGKKAYHKGDVNFGNGLEALKRLVKLYGKSDIWFLILNAYDLRRKVL